MNANLDGGYVIYLRKSNGRKAVPRQRAIITAYIDRRGGTVLREFKDTDRTAYAKPGQGRPDRDDFDRMIDLLRSRKNLVVIAWHADRLIRNQEDTATLISVCAANGHTIETPGGGVYDLSTASGRKRLRDDASDAEYEVDHLVERVTAQKDEAAALGLWLGGRRPFGWKIWENPVDDDGEAILDEDGHPARGYLLLHDIEAPALREAGLNILDGGSSVRAEVIRMNREGITTSTGGEWTQSELRRVFLRPRNAGLYVHRGQVAGKTQAPAIFDEHTWRRLVRLLTAPDRRWGSATTEAKHLLSGIAKCGICGAPLKKSPAGRDQQVYRCRAAGKGGKAHISRDAATLDAFVTAVVIALFRREDAAQLLAVQHESTLPELELRKTAVEEAMRESNDLRRRGLLTPEEFAQDRKEHLAEIERLDAAIAEAGDEDELTPMLRDPEAVWKTRTLEQKRRIIRAVMTVTVNPQGKGRPKGWRPGQPYFDPEAVKCKPVNRAVTAA